MSTAQPSANVLLDDADLERTIRLHLSNAGHRPIQALHLEVSGGVVTLRGKVPSFYVRQLAIACVRRVAGVRVVNDHIRAAPQKTQRPLHESPS